MSHEFIVYNPDYAATKTVSYDGTMCVIICVACSMMITA